MCGEIPSQAIQLSKLYQTLLNSDSNVGFWFWLSNFFCCSFGVVLIHLRLIRVCRKAEKAGTGA